MSDKWGWLPEPEGWRAIPVEEGKPRVCDESPVRDRLDMIVKAGAAGRSFLVRRGPLERDARSSRTPPVGIAGSTARLVHLRGEEAAG
jgi:hypothetical protein